MRAQEWPGPLADVSAAHGRQVSATPGRAWFAARRDRCLVGDYNLTTTSVSFGRGGRSTNRAVRRERVLDVADLTALPKGRTVVFASGAPATLVRRVPWMDGPDAARVTASIRAHDPAAEDTVAAVAEGVDLAGTAA